MNFKTIPIAVCMISLLVLGFCAGTASAQSDYDVGVVEQLGSYVPMDATFTDSTGQTVTLGDIVDKPTIIVPVFFTCTNVCNIVQASLADVLGQAKDTVTPGEDFTVVSISFNDEETSADAAQDKKNFLNAVPGGFPESEWRFLVGSQENIDAVMNAIGFSYKRVENDFLHPVVIAVVSEDGKIVRYLYGTTFLKLNIVMAVYEAAEGRIGNSFKKVVEFCFSYDPSGQKYVFNVLRVTGIATLGMAGLIFVILIVFGKKRSDEHGR